MKRTIKSKNVWGGLITNQVLSDILFDELVVRNAEIIDVEFRNINFKDCYLGFNSQYTKCRFIDCVFQGRNSSLGTPCSFSNCRFENCDFTGTDLFQGVHLHNCYISGKIKNVILRDKDPKIENNETVFDNCDLANLTFDNIAIYGKDVFNNCIFPKSGIKRYDNTGDVLLRRAEEICKKIDSQDKVETEIVFKKDLKQGQNPIILDEPFLASFFKSESSKNIFLEVTDGFEIK